MNKYILSVYKIKYKDYILFYINSVLNIVIFYLIPNYFFQSEINYSDIYNL